MKDFCEGLRAVLMHTALVCGLGMFAALTIWKVWQVIKPRVRDVNWKAALAAIPFIVIAALYGGSKPSISYPYTDPKTRYFTDAGSEVRDDSLWLAFTAMRIPLSADFHGCYRPLVEEGQNTNEWVEFLLGTVGQFLTPQEIPFPNAKSYEFCFFSTYVEGPTVHTNGVLNVKWGIPTKALDEVIRALPIQSEVRVDWGIIATPDSTFETRIVPAIDENLLQKLNEEINDNLEVIENEND